MDHRPIHPRPATDNKPRWIWRVFQWKYDVDQNTHWLTRWYFRYIFLPFNRWSYDHFRLFPPDSRDRDGRLSWKETQGAFESECEAQQDAANYPFGQAVKMPLHASLPAESVFTEQRSPNSPKRIQKMYQREHVVCPYNLKPCNPHEERVDRRDLVSVLTEVEKLV